MNDIFIVNYRHSASTPLKSITQLPKEEAFAIAEKLYTNSQCRAHRRFGPDFPSYYEYRLEIEHNLYNGFVSIGGKPQIEHPYYFAVESCESLCRNFDSTSEIRLNIVDIASCDISFSLGDSMAQAEKGRDYPVFTKETLLNLFNQNGGAEKYISEIKREYAMIEAQLWTDKYFGEN